MGKQILRAFSGLLLGLLVLSLFALFPGRAKAANPATINFQGKVVNSDGTNVTNGTYSFIFRIYNTSSPTMTTTCTSTATCLWQETQGSVSVTNGIFQVELGSVCALTSASCNNTAGGPINYSSTSSLYLTLQFNGDTSGSNGGYMSPLMHITSVPFAFQADNSATLGGLAAGNFVQLAQGLQTDSSTTNASIAINKTGGTANVVTLQRGGTSVFVLDTNGALSLTPNGNNVGTVVRQTSGTATSGNIFDIQGANGTSHFIQVAETAANAGSISITSLGSNAVTIDSGSGTVVFGSTTTTVQKAGGAFTVDVSNGASNSTLTISNSGGAGNITLNLDAGGSYAVGGTAGTTVSACSGGQFLTGTLSGGIVTSGSCGTPTAYSTVQDEGVALTQRSAINFTGAGVTCADNAGSTRTDCTIPGGSGGTFATTYSTTSQPSNTITYSNSGGGALIIQNASTPLTTLFTIQNNAATFNYLTVTLASSIPHLQVFGASSTAYADIYYDAGASTAHFSASTGTTQIGTGSGAVNITAGTGSAVAITGDANSTFTTTTGLVRLDGPSGVELGTASTRNGDLKFINLTNTNIIDITVPSGASAPGAAYTLTLPSSVGSPNQCLQSGGTAGVLTFAACGSSSGTALSINGGAVGSTGNFVNTTATGTSTGVTYTNTTGTLSTAIGNASTSVAGAVTTGSQSFAGDKIFQSTTNSSTAFQIQNSVASPVLLVDTTSTDATGSQLNYIAYSGFESGNPPTGWTATNPTGGTTTLTQNSNKQHTFNGLFSASVAVGANTGGGGGMHTSTFTSAPPGSTNYIVSFYAKITSGTIASNAFTVTTTGGAGSCSPAAGITINPSGFQRLYCQLNAGAGSITDFKISDNVTTAHTLYIDAVQMQPTSYNGVTLTTPSAYQFGEIQLRGVITNPLIVANNGDSTSAFQIQKSSGAAVITADTLNGQVLLGNASSLTGLLTFNNSSGANTVGITSGNVSTSYTITLPTAVAATNNYCLVSTTGGVTSWAACGASATTRLISLVPEFPGAVMTPDGGSNSGTMTSDFCGNDGAGSFVDLNTGVCNTSGDFHNYYSWTSNGANDYDIFVRWRVPSDFSSFSTVQFNSKKSATGDDVKLTIFTNTGAGCGTGTSMTNTAAAWQTTTYTISGCAPSPGDMLIFDIHMAVAANGNTCQMGEIPITYNRS